MQLLDSTELISRLARAGLLEYSNIDEETGIATIRFKKSWDTIRDLNELRHTKRLAAISRGLRVKEERASLGVCPDCGKELMRAEGCLTCRWCGYSKC